MPSVRRAASPPPREPSSARRRFENLRDETSHSNLTDARFTTRRWSWSSLSKTSNLHQHSNASLVDQDLAQQMVFGNTLLAISPSLVSVYNPCFLTASSLPTAQRQRRPIRSTPWVRRARPQGCYARRQLWKEFDDTVLKMPKEKRQPSGGWRSSKN